METHNSSFMHLQLTTLPQREILPPYNHLSSLQVKPRLPSLLSIKCISPEQLPTQKIYSHLVEMSSEDLIEEEVGLLEDRGLPEVERNLVQQAISQTFESTAHLANLLPTGSVLAFQLLAPIFTNQGDCDATSRVLTAALVALCGLSCILLSFTDSIKDKNGNVCYGFATFRGFWLIDGSATLSQEIAAAYKLKFIDFAHALMSILVFAAIAMFDQNTVKCFYPEPSTGTQEILTAVPVGIGVICSMLFVVFPTKRHGIGFPVSNDS